MRTRILLSALAAIGAILVFSVGANASTGATNLSAHARVFRPVGQPQGGTSGAIRKAQAAGSSNNLMYNGGHVLTSPGAFIIYWGSQWSTGFSTGGYSSSKAQTYVNSFFGGVGGSSWFNSQTQYCQGVAIGSQFCSGGQNVTNPTGQLKGTWVDTSTVPRHPTDAQVQAEAQRGASHFGYSANALYMVFTPHSHNISGFGTQFCAYHDNTTFNGQDLAYANMPYIPDAGFSCGMNFINGSNNSFGNGYFDGFSIVAGHEYAEASTDAFPSDTLAWVDSSTAETGDKCAWDQGPGPDVAANISLGGNQFAVQTLWSNLANSTTGGCVISG